MKAFLLLCLYVGISAAENNTYFILAPQVARSGQPYNVQVQILNASEPVNVNVTLVSSQAEPVTEIRSVSQGDSVEMALQTPDVQGSFLLHVMATGGLTFSNEATVKMSEKTVAIFIQTDKAIYKPGETVHFRVLATWSSLLKYDGTFDIMIEDPNGNRIKNFEEVRGEKGVFEEEMVMSSKPLLGDWKITASTQGQKKSVVFSVEKYVLPKFEVTVTLPPFSLAKEEEVKGHIEAKYTYGKAVDGEVTIDVNIEYNEGTFRKITTQLKDGIAEFSINTVDIVEKLRKPWWTESTMPDILRLADNSLKVIANVTDSLSGVSMTGEGSLTFFKHEKKFDFPSYNPKVFVPGLTYTAEIEVTNPNGSPLTPSDELMMISVGREFGGIFDRTEESNITEPPFAPPPIPGAPPPMRDMPEDPALFITQIKEFSSTIETSENMTLVPGEKLRVTFPCEANAEYMLLHFRIIGTEIVYSKRVEALLSPSNTFLQITLQSPVPLNVGETSQFLIKGTHELKTIDYQIQARGVIVKAGKLQVGGAKEYTFDLPLTAEMAPSCRILIYYVTDDGEVVNSAINVNIKGAIKNKVSLKSDSDKVAPAENITLTVKADGGSYVGLVAVDQSVLLLRSGNDLTSVQILKELESFSDASSPDDHFNFDDDIVFRCFVCFWPRPVDGKDASSVFKNSGMLVLTDATVFQDPEEHMILAFRNKEVFFDGAVFANAVPLAGFAPVERVRSKFPETWIWENRTVGDDGELQMQFQVPDTITSWVISAFALNEDSGLGGVESPTSVTVFQSFFVSLLLPYSAVRFEELILKATVYNYLDEDLDVRVSIGPSDEFHLIKKIPSREKPLYFLNTYGKSIFVKAPAGKGVTVAFPIVPRKLGRVNVKVTAQSAIAADAVERKLLVLAEGVPDEYAESHLILLEDGENFGASVPITFPPGTVVDSRRVEVNVVGDVMGPTLSNLDNLLKMPYGCGEQTMLTFAPNIFVTQYLNSTDQLTPSIRQKATNFMEKGYQRELTFQRHDGSFSAFGQSDPEGSMWLTAFVAKSFAQASPFVYIDNNVILKALKWILERQAENGSFPEPGNVIHKEMQGAASGGDALTAYVIAAIVEQQDLPEDLSQQVDDALMLGLSYLEQRMTQTTNPYSLSILHYALALMDKETTMITNKLELSAKREDGLVYWDISEDSPPSGPTPMHTKSTSIEMSAYNALAHIAAGNTSDALDVARFLIKHRNANGGFVSTQDTVMGLQALAEIASQLYSSRRQNLQIDATFGANESHTFDINEDNSLLLQTFVASSIPQSVRISAQGTGVGLVQVAVSYNKLVRRAPSAFDLQVTVVKDTEKAIIVKACCRYTKDSNSASGMAILQFGLISGFSGDADSIGKVEGLKKVEEEDREVILYLDSVPSNRDICASLTMVRTATVGRPKPAYVTVYDYYSKGDAVTKAYESNAMKETSICDLAVAESENGCGA